MSAAFRRVCQRLAGRPFLRVAVQALVSAGLIALLVQVARRGNLGESLGRLRAETIVLVMGLGLLQVFLAGCRWQILLRQVGVQEPLGRLARLYLIGLFFSLFLPTSSGGDAVRIYEVARRSGRTAETFLATLQERFLGLGLALLVGAFATVYYLPVLPRELGYWAVGVQFAGAAGSLLLLYPAFLARVVRGCAVWLPASPASGLAVVVPPRWYSGLTRKLSDLARPVADLAPFSAARLVLLVGVSLSGTLLGVAMYSVIGTDLGIGADFLAFCLVVPLVWIVRMAPVSLNGIGVGEGAFVFLMGLFNVPEPPALALALAMLGLQTCLSLLGGLLLVLQTVVKRRQALAGRGRQVFLRADAAHQGRPAAPHRRAA